MALLDVELETKKFTQKLESGYYGGNVSFEVMDDGYTKEREERDTNAVKEFVHSNFFDDFIKNLA